MKRIKEEYPNCYCLENFKNINDIYKTIVFPIQSKYDFLNLSIVLNNITEKLQTLTKHEFRLEKSKYYDLKYKAYSVTVKDFQNSISDSTAVLSYFSPKSADYIYAFVIGKTNVNIHYIKDIDLNRKIKSFRKHLFLRDARPGQGDCGSFPGHVGQEDA